MGENKTDVNFLKVIFVTIEIVGKCHQIKLNYRWSPVHQFDITFLHFISSRLATLQATGLPWTPGPVVSSMGRSPPPGPSRSRPGRASAADQLLEEWLGRSEMKGSSVISHMMYRRQSIVII